MNDKLRDLIEETIIESGGIVPKEQYLKIIEDNFRSHFAKEMPPIEKAHTYASENAEIYRAFDEGQRYYRNLALKAIEGER